MNSSKWPAKAVLPVAVPGIKYILGILLMIGVLFYFGWVWPGIALCLIWVFVCWFFRDPDRTVPEDDTALVSPADGRVIGVDRIAGCAYFDRPCIKVSIFMNVFNVHVNRLPFSGTIDRVIYSPGKFINASFDKASEHNERNAMVVRTPSGERYAVVQIAGLVARRIVNCAREGEYIRKGSRYGMIQFGSRLDLYLPVTFTPVVSVGDKVSSGSSVLGHLP